MLLNNNNNNNSLLNVRFGSLLDPRGLLLIYIYIYMGRKLYLKKPRDLSLYLLGLAYKVLTSHL